jgi:hypothetical protein
LRMTAAVVRMRADCADFLVAVEAHALAAMAASRPPS